MADIVDVELLPFGNAVYNASLGGKLECQHGDVECIGNSVLQCAMDEYPNQKVHLPFASCFERYGPYFWGNYNDTADPGHLMQYTRICAWSHGMDYSRITSCVQDADRSAKLQRQYFERTKQTRGLYPSVFDLTWVSINGKQDGTNGAQLLKEVCDAYTGPPPIGCANVTVSGEPLTGGGHALTTPPAGRQTAAGAAAAGSAAMAAARCTRAPPNYN